jgi:hypothetical protein
MAGLPGISDSLDAIVADAHRMLTDHSEAAVREQLTASLSKALQAEGTVRRHEVALLAMAVVRLAEADR